MRCNIPAGIALLLGLGLAVPAAAQDAREEASDDLDLDALLGDDDPAEKPAAEADTPSEAEAEAEPEAKAEPEIEGMDKDSLSLVSYEARAKFDSQYYGHTLVRAERHLGHVDVYFLTQDGKKMMAEVRPDGTLGKVEKASW